MVQAAARHLARFGGAAAPLLVKRLKSGSRDVRLAVIKALGEIGPLAEAAVPALLPIAAAAQGSKVPAVDVVLAEAAFEALKQIVSSTTPEVRQGLQSPSPDMRAVCIGLIEHSLQRTPAAERQEPVDALLKLLGDGEPTVRSAAADVLGCIGPQARPAVGLLEELAGDETPLEHPMRLGASAEPASSVSLDPFAAQDGSPADTVGAHARAALLRIRLPAQ